MAWGETILTHALNISCTVSSTERLRDCMDKCMSLFLFYGQILPHTAFFLQVAHADRGGRSICPLARSSQRERGWGEGRRRGWGLRLWLFLSLLSLLFCVPLWFSFFFSSAKSSFYQRNQRFRLLFQVHSIVNTTFQNHWIQFTIRCSTE